MTTPAWASSKQITVFETPVSVSDSAGNATPVSRSTRSNALPARQTRPGRRMKIDVVCIHHPSWIFRGNWAHSAIQPQFLTRARQISEGTYQPIDITSAPPSANLFPSVLELRDFVASHPGPFTVDLECAGPYLICVGVLDAPSEDYVCFRFRRQGGDIWDPSDLPDRTKILYEFLADPSALKIFQNGQAFDIPYLEEVGFHVAGYHDDTMLQAHLAYAELPKRLEFLALVYTGIPRWKLLVSPDDEEKEK